MKRKIKFRAWDNITKSFVLPSNLVFRLDGHLFDSEFDEELHHVELMQFTGLLDKNGKEIYEGDILRITTDYGYTEIGHIIYVPITARFGFLSPDESVYGLHTNDEKNKVIGNIYENPELLNQ